MRKNLDFIEVFCLGIFFSALLWCEGGDLNPHEIAFTWTWTMRVCQFRHSRIFIFVISLSDGDYNIIFLKDCQEVFSEIRHFQENLYHSVSIQQKPFRPSRSWFQKLSAPALAAPAEDSNIWSNINFSQLPSWFFGAFQEPSGKPRELLPKRMYG